MINQRSWGGKRLGAGRPRGSRGKRTEVVEELLERLNCNPIEGMARIANNDKAALGITEDIPIALRARMYEALAPYLQPKLKSTEISVELDRPEINGSLSVTEKFIADALKHETTVGECEAETNEQSHHISATHAQ